MKEDKKLKYKKAGFHWSVVAVFAIGCLVVFSNIQLVSDNEGEWHTIAIIRPARAHENTTVSAGECGFLGIYLCNHTASPATAYDSNSSDDLSDWCNTTHGSGAGYAIADAFNKDIKHGAKFDVVVRARFNDTYCNSELDRCRVRIWFNNSGAWADGEDIAYSDAAEGSALTHNQSGTMLWTNFYWTASDDGGYEISPDQTITIDKIVIEAQY